MKKPPRPSPGSFPSLRKRRAWPWTAALLAGLALTAGAFSFWAASDATDPGPAPEGMVWVPPGEFTMGSAEFPDALPAHRCHVDGFWMDRTEVTNEQFAAFVAATGYKTIAEQTPTANEFPTVPPDKLVPFSGVFVPPARCNLQECSDCGPWWRPVAGACWRHPEGPRSSTAGREKHPVVHIAWHDAVAYAEWAGKRLPTEAEWERAARGGVEGKPFYWGDELRPGGRWAANIWQGDFPTENTAEDGYAGAAPVASYPPNAFGLYDMSGNVWEWCADWYQPGYAVNRLGRRHNPQGPLFSIDPDGRDEPKRVQRGGSFLCSDLYCKRYRAGARGHGEPRSSQSHTGFRCVRSPGEGK
jgi:formylglycine-generating enzyme required for sulfatase activity